jgi:hypothetical protein
MMVVPKASGSRVGGLISGRTDIFREEVVY